MTPPDRLVEAAAEAYHRWQYGDNGTHDTLMEAAEVANVILAATFAALPKCDETIEALAAAFAGEGNTADDYDRDDARRYLDHLAREFGSRRHHEP